MSDLSEPCQDLYDLLNTRSETRDLARSLAAVHEALNDHWSTNHMPWFTDHGVKHARNVAAISLKLASLLYSGSATSLTPLEKYLLCSAALLHDIGMNDLGASLRKAGELQEKDHLNIRKQHAKRSGELISENYARWGLPARDNVIAGAVSLIARAHGTSEYRRTVPELQKYKRVRGAPVSTPLLAAILLMADELDLHYERAGGIPDVLNPISEAHDFKHRCVTYADIAINPVGEIQMELELSIPKTLEDDDREAIEKWIVSKLRRQVSLVEPEISSIHGIHKFSRTIKATHGNALPPELPSPEALAIIRSEAASDALMDHSNSLTAAEESLLTATNLILLVGRWEKSSATDLDGAEDVLDTLARRATANGHLLLRSRRLAINAAGEASDVLGEWVRDLHASFRPPPRHLPESTRRANVLKSLLRKLSALPHRELLILTLSFLDGMEDDGRQWLLTEAVPKILDSTSTPVSILITTSAETPIEYDSLRTEKISVTHFDIEEVEEHLRQYEPGLWANILSRSDLSYSDIKKMAIDLEKELRGV